MDLDQLENIITQRAAENVKKSYTAKLLAEGPARCAKKLGEEGVETALAVALGDRDEIVSETADLFYHVLVALKGAGIPLTDIYHELAERTGQSGLQEKENRK